jgi:hypothetical protein
MPIQIIISNSQNSPDLDPSLALIEFQGTLECDQADLRGLSVGDFEEDDKVRWMQWLGSTACPLM